MAWWQSILRATRSSAMIKIQDDFLIDAGEDWVDGAIFSFSTTPYFDFSDPETGRYAAFKVLEISDERTVVAVLDGIWPQAPSFANAQLCSILNCHRFPHFERLRAKAAIIAVPKEWGGDAATVLQNLKCLGRTRVTNHERVHIANLITHATWHSIDHDAEGEWRFVNDSANFEEECEKSKAISHAKWMAEQERYEKRLKGLTWEKLLGELLLERWQESPPFPSAAFTEESRQRIRDLCEQIIAFGPKPKKAEVRKAMQSCVEWFNEKDEAAGGVIETEEREDICAVLEEIAFVARHKSLTDEVENWRSW